MTATPAQARQFFDIPIDILPRENSFLSRIDTADADAPANPA
jgi:hypothetical protein